MTRNGRPTVNHVAADIELVAQKVAQLTTLVTNLEERIQTAERRLNVRMESMEGDLRDEITSYRLEFVDLKRALDPLNRWANPPAA